ncbi:unnamed protein product [Orchesella dallaii]|uniref:F-box domain-containing protein n=1 Tax=Orchesella dallaii TaxID=48710 RepID=A0ABP1PWZ6_9HEXA
MDQEKAAGKPSPVAKKSCTKGALKDLKKKLQYNGLANNDCTASTSKSAIENDGTAGCSTDGDYVSVGGLNQSDSEVNNSHNIGNGSRQQFQQSLTDTDDELIPCTPKKARVEFRSDILQSPRKMCPTQLVLPKNVTNKILQYLTPLEQLSLRRVCKSTYDWVFREEKDITLWEEEKWRNYNLTISGEGVKTFESVTKMGLPITRYTFDIEGAFLYEDEFLDNFLISVGMRVKDLTLQKFFMFQDSNEYKMFQSLHNLEKLTLNNLVVSEMSTSAPPNPCPSTLKNLQVLKINYEITAPEDNALIRPKSWDLTWSMLHDCKRLLYFRFPRVHEMKVSRSHTGIFAPLMDYVEMRLRLGGISIEYLDLKHFGDTDSLYINRFMELLRKCHSKDIKLKNINAQVVQQVFDEDEITDKKLAFCENIVSLINYRPFVETAPLRNLQKITIDVVPSATGYVTLGRDYKRIFWPSLHTIKINDTFQERDYRIQELWQIIQEDLYGLNASGINRRSVKYIAINSPRFPYFLSEGRLAQKFTLVTKLKISSWYRDDKRATLNKRLVAIWKKLKLEELVIEKCPKLNDNSFIGDEEDEEQLEPAFLKLAPSLKVCTIDLDGTRLTDRCFVDVFSRMKFKTLILLSTRPVDISEAALLRMLNGEFGKCIERFPFDTWSTSKISPDRFKRLGRKFRSML